MFAPLEHWHEFYLLVGTAAAAMVALLFVAASIGAGILSAERTMATRLYISPVVVHFTNVLFACAIGLVPSHSNLSFGFLIGLAAAVGTIYSGFLAISVLKDRAVDLTDRLAYGLAPVVGYAVACAAAVMIVLGSYRGPDVLAAAILLLMIVNIRNAWDLALFMTRQHTARRSLSP
jgi:hypothetical protein